MNILPVSLTNRNANFKGYINVVEKRAAKYASECPELKDAIAEFSSNHLGDVAVIAQKVNSHWSGDQYDIVALDENGNT